MAWLRLYAPPLQIFLLTRLGLFLLSYVSLVLLPVAPGIRRSYPNNLLLDGWARWDSGWYFSIVSQGYSLVSQNEFGQTNVAFFPLYPLVIWLAHHVVGHPFVTGIVVSNVAFLLALLLLYRVLSYHHGPRATSRALILLSVFPFSFYFTAMYSESLFLLTVVLSFYWGERKRWVLAGLAAAAAGATRHVGVLVMVGLTLLYLEHAGFQWRRVRPNALWILLGLLGPGGFMAYLAFRFGDPLIFLKAQMVAHWIRDLGPDRLLTTLAAVGSFDAIAAGRYPLMSLVHLLVAVGALALAVAAWGRPRASYAVWALLTLGASLTAWTGVGRYVAPLFPIFLVAALRLDDDARFWPVVYVSTLVLALFTIMFTHAYWVA